MEGHSDRGGLLASSMYHLGGNAPGKNVGKNVT